MTELPPLYEDGFLTSAPGPLVCRGTTLYGFWARADGDKLRTLCREAFERVTGGAVECRPLFANVLITFGVIARIDPIPEPYDALGYVTERQVGIWVPVRCSGPDSLPPIASYIPLMWLDDPLSVASGREMYGYPKGWGWPRFEGDGTDGGPPGSGRPERFTLEVYGIERYPRRGASAPIDPLDLRTPARHPLIEIHRVGLLSGLVGSAGGEASGAAAGGADGAPAEGDELADLAEIAQASARALEPLEPLEAAGAGLGDVLRLLRAEVPQLFLKQFRDVEDGMRACLQQVTLAPARVDRLHGLPRILGPHELVVAHLDSHPLGPRLGLGSGRLPLSFQVRMDFTVRPGTVVWDSRAAAAAAPGRAPG